VTARPTPSGAETSLTLDRALRLLELLADPGLAGALSVSDLAVRLGSSRPAVYRLVATLARHGLVDRDGAGQVRLGTGLLALARAVVPRLHDAAIPVLRQLADEMGATAHLTVVEPGSDGSEAVAVAVVEPGHTAMHVAYRVGARHALDRGAAGRAILLARAGRREPPFVLTEGELQPGAVGIASPVLGVAGLEASVGVITLSGLTSIDPEVAGPRIVRAAAAIAAALT
jgi:DNA-binding IclR family transcriptional regulator